MEVPLVTHLKYLFTGRKICLEKNLSKKKPPRHSHSKIFFTKYPNNSYTKNPKSSSQKQLLLHEEVSHQEQLPSLNNKTPDTGVLLGVVVFDSQFGISSNPEREVETFSHTFRGGKGWWWEGL